MSTAEEMGMINDEYVYISYGMVPTTKNEQPWLINYEERVLSDDEIRSKKRVFDKFKQVSPILLINYCVSMINCAFALINLYNQ